MKLLKKLRRKFARGLKFVARKVHRVGVLVDPHPQKKRKVGRPRKGAK